ncbi:MAG TPA: GspE/PulE family protein [Patescibacteria group bacterium]
MAEVTSPIVSTPSEEVSKTSHIPLVLSNMTDEERAKTTATVESIKTFIEQELSRQPSEFSIARLIDLLIAYASLTRTSDMHIDPTPENVRVRFRVDGILYDVFSLPKIIQSLLVARTKILCGLRTDEHQVPQDGRFKVLLKDIGTVDLRVSIVPTYYGENVELRLLQSPSEKLTIDGLDMSPSDLAKVKRAMTRPYGMILATGPTGSGKTTMLYTILKTLNTPDVSVITIEDPIEYSIDGIEQIQINPQSGLTFAAGLRAILRQDPNIIMVGEIRDEETAEIAVNAALTGHLLLSTLHTNDAATTLARLTEFKIEPFLIASTVNLAIGQRLVRLLCPYCRIPKTITEAEYQSLAEVIPIAFLGDNRQFFAAQGCEQCGQSGFIGRTGIYEVLLVDDAIREAIMRRANANEIVALAMQKGMTTMLQDGFRKALEGKTTVEEVLRVVHE